MTKKETVIRRFAKAMRDANVVYIGDTGKFTLNMKIYWDEYVETCKAEDKQNV